MGRRKQNIDLDSQSSIKFWNVALYIRLSREDDNEDDSESIVNQEKILKDYLEKDFLDPHVIVDIYVDDGKTGTNVNRPNFQRMIQDIENKKINCIIVKSLSRAFRNTGDQAKFLEEYFPRKNVRFIATGTPFIDTYRGRVDLSAKMMGAFNEEWPAITSDDVRKTFKAKRKRGEFIGAFAPYGYKKDPDNKNHLIIDEEAAEVVRLIFNWYASGKYSKSQIVRELNNRGIPSPFKYKKDKGIKHQIPNPSKQMLWSFRSVATILENEVYIGNMIQGKQTVISYKIKQKIATHKSEWVKVEDTHDAIIDKEIFYKVQELLVVDTRVVSKGNVKGELDIFSGMLVCADCGKAMHMKRNGKQKDGTYKYVQYVCRTYSENSKSHCTRHAINKKELSKAVLVAIQNQISFIVDMASIIENIEMAPQVENEVTSLQLQYNKVKDEIEKYQFLEDGLYEDYKLQIITGEQYVRLKNDYLLKIESRKAILENINQKITEIQSGTKSNDYYFQLFKKYQNITKLERSIVLELIEKIKIYEDKTIEIIFKFEDQLQKLVDYIEKLNNQKDVISYIPITSEKQLKAVS